MVLSIFVHKRLGKKEIRRRIVVIDVVRDVLIVVRIVVKIVGNVIVVRIVRVVEDR
jgi:hypothetical protein